MGGPPWRVVEVTCAAEEKKLKLSLAEHWSWKKIGDLKAAVAKKLHAPPGDLALHTAAGACDDGAFLRDHVVEDGVTAFVARRGANEPPPPPPPPGRDGAARHRERGNAAFGRGDLDEAASCYELALVFDPRDAKSLANLASVALARRRAGDAAAYCARALRCGAAGDPLGKWWLRLARAQRLGRRFADEKASLEAAAAAGEDAAAAVDKATAQLADVRERVLAAAAASRGDRGDRGARNAALLAVDPTGAVVLYGAAQESEIPNFKGSDLGDFPLVSADFWTSDHLSERSRSVDACSGTRARGTLTLKRR